MPRFPCLVLVVAAAIGVLASAANAFPTGHATLAQDWGHALSRLSPNLGIIKPGDCILVRQEIIDASNRVRLRLVRVCD